MAPLCRPASRLALAAALAGSLGAPLTAAAQAGNTGIVEGRVVAAEGSALPGAEIHLQRLDGVLARQTVTDAQGSFRFVFLAPGIYRVTARRIGFHSRALERVEVLAGRVASLLITLEARATALDSIVVVAAPVSISLTDTDFGSRLLGREIRLLPTSLDPSELVAFTPGARPAQVWGAVSAPANSYRLDGVAVNHPGQGGNFLEPSVQWLEEVEVRGLGAGAEVGNFQGGLINFVLKSGTNRFSSTFRSTLETDGLNASNLFVTEVGKELAGRRELDAQVSGPLRRDRLFYAGFAQLIDRDFRAVNRVAQIDGTFAPVLEGDRTGKVLGKLSWHAGGRDVVAASAGWFGTDGDRVGLTGFESPEATLRRRANTFLYNLSWQRSWSSRSSIEVKLGGFSSRDHRDPYAGADVPGLETLLLVDPRRFQNAPFREYRAPTSATLSADWDLSRRVLGADHHLKLGGEHGIGGWVFRRQRNGGLTWRPQAFVGRELADPANPATWVGNGVLTSTWGGEVNLDAGVENSAVYLQDDIRVARWLSLSAGVRWGRWVGKLRRPDGGERFTAVRDDAFDPRVGLAVDLSGHGSFAAKAHWGRFHQNLFAAFFDRTTGAQVYSNEERWEYRGPVFGDPRTRFTEVERDALAERGTFARVETIRRNETGTPLGYRQPHVDQLVLGLEKTIGSRWKAEALYLRRRNRDLVALVDLNLASNYVVFDSVTVLDRFFRPVSFQGEPLELRRLAISNEDILKWAGIAALQMELPPQLAAVLGSLTYDPDIVLTNVPDARREFDQLQLNLSARYPRWWASASVTLTDLEGNFNSLTGDDDYADPGAGPYVRLNEQFDAFGALSNQSQIEAKVQLGGELGAGFRGGAFFAYYSGDRVTPTLTLSHLLQEFELAGPATVPRERRRLRGYFIESLAGHRVFVRPRGSLRYAGRATLDVHLERGFSLGRSELAVTLDLFNALGARTITEVQTSLTGEIDVDGASSYAATRARVPPRTLRLGLSLVR